QVDYSFSSVTQQKIRLEFKHLNILNDMKIHLRVLSYCLNNIFLKHYCVCGSCPEIIKTGSQMKRTYLQTFKIINSFKFIIQPFRNFVCEFLILTFLKQFSTFLYFWVKGFPTF
ncbi:hypothetical protein L9F63_019173, partial [Diploptera punctata]